jgi:hypothetical protein
VRIEGKCHCDGIAFTLNWPGGDTTIIPARACTCTFCVKHGGRWTSHPAATLEVRTGSTASRYRFGTKTADFHVCTQCGVVPVVTFEGAGRQYAVVNVNTFEGVDGTQLQESSASFDGEGIGDRLARRERNWIANVTFRG